MSHLTLPHETAFQRQCLRAILAEYRAQAIDVLRRAGLDPSDSGKLGTAALYEPTNPIGAAWRVLRTVHQVELLITDKNALDAFNLGKSFLHDVLLMRYPDIINAFQDREKKLVNKQLNKKRHAKTYQARDLVLSEWEQNIHRFPSAAKAGIHFADWLGERNYKFEPRTVTGWILKRAKEKGVKFR